MWSAVSECNDDTALDSSVSGLAGEDRDGAFIQGGVARSLPTAVHGSPPNFQYVLQKDEVYENLVS